MIHEYRKHQDRRHKSAVKPLLYLILEFILLAIVCLMVHFLVELTIIHVLVVVGALFFFITSSLKRYRMVRDRQKFYKE